MELEADPSTDRAMAEKIAEWHHWATRGRYAVDDWVP
jgi:hypothetical protein